MWVRSEDGLRLDDAPPWTGKYTHDDKPYVIWGKTNRLIAAYITKEEALARMDDVTEWLQAKPWFPTGEKITVTDEDGETWTREKWVKKPLVYEFSKPIGYWKEGVK